MAPSKMFFIGLFVFLLQWFFSVAAFSASPDVRVGLYTGSGAVLESTISCDGGLAAIDGENTIPIPAKDCKALLRDGKLMLCSTDNTENVYASFEGQNLIRMVPTTGILSLDGKRYRGSLTIGAQSDKLSVINVLPLDEYLYGVLPSEVSPSWPYESLKSQAVCARSYFYASGKDRHRADGYDVCPSVHCQAYKGFGAENSKTNDAVNDTAGQIVTFNGKVALTVYSASNGGYTEDNVNVWGSFLPYLTARMDEFDNGLVNKSFAWTLSLTKEQLTEKCKSFGIEIGEVTGIGIAEKSASGRVIALKVTGSTGVYIAKNEKCRTLFGFRSQMYDLISSPTKGSVYTISSSGTSQQYIPVSILSAQGVTTSADFSMLSGNGTLSSPSPGGEAYVFSGRGYGHGLGMSQWGAYARAAAGQTMEQIIAFYYPETQIERVY